MKNEMVTLDVSDGSVMNAYVAYPDITPTGAIMVFQEIFGVNSYIKSIADRFAKEGYIAIAPELFHRTAPGFESGYESMDAGRKEASALTQEGLLADIAATYEWIKGNTQVGSTIASVGFCMGGRVSYLANATCTLRAAISFYGSGIAPTLLDRAPHLLAPMLFFWGGKDAGIPRESWQTISAALDGAQKEYCMVEMGEAGHGFFCDQRASFHKKSAELAWPLVLNFLAQNLV